MADQASAKAIIAFAPWAQTAFRLASNRPNAAIYAFTTNKQLINQLSLVWGVRAFYIEPERDVDDAFKYSIKIPKQNKLISNGDLVVHVSGLPLFEMTGVNTIKLSYV
jgi:pyruvate kinase